MDFRSKPPQTLFHPQQQSIATGAQRCLGPCILQEHPNDVPIFFIGDHQPFGRDTALPRHFMGYVYAVFSKKLFDLRPDRRRWLRHDQPASGPQTLDAYLIAVVVRVDRVG